MVYTVKCMWDDEAKVWIADSDDIPENSMIHYCQEAACKQKTENSW